MQCTVLEQLICQFSIAIPDRKLEKLKSGAEEM